VELPQQEQGELNAEETKKLEDAAPAIANIFETARTPQERIDVILSRFKPFFDAGLLDEKALMLQIENCCSVEDKDTFIQRVTELAKVYFLAKRRDTTGVEHVAMVSEQGRTAVNEILDYDYDDNGKTIQIHLAPTNKPGMKKLKELMLSGLQDLADVVEQNEGILKIGARSPLVYKNPRLVEKLGFKLVGDVYIWKGEKSRASEMSREEFLERYLREQ
ncbi:MAG: hypothetical protein ABSA74_03940, partial [Candidatus Staskawiczbacteria bacterium]